MSEPAADPRERTILLMAIGTLCLIVVMAGVSVMTLLTILFPPPIPEGAAPGVDAVAPIDPEGSSGEASSNGATQGEGTQGEVAPRDPGPADPNSVVPSGPASIGAAPGLAAPGLAAPGGSADPNTAPRR